ncbi:ABC transporter transmembrane domain-containing protein [Rhodobium gokarnense]|uniref:ATP-binding cassette subfamily B protein n=1 Tax=Rhodobium gokarnense TaxID=364296 RepID=A0ABT3H6Y9_9HYPH|nr:ABC transporter transmembrane domain-containing protein [Rhodobium gokarnense]MCW2306162.1 ATP-binding cassette subfamily B protein [Rhodobium gokarnense]
MARRRHSAARQDTDNGRKSRSLRPLATLIPFMMRYRGHLLAALVALLAATVATLIVPLAVRRMIDHGFSGAETNLIDKYFAMLVVVAAALAIASACRYYYVTWLGERVVADLRAAVFAHITRLSPAFFDTAKSGEVVSRLTADTTQIKATVGATASQALRNFLLFVGAMIMMVVTSPRLSGMVLLAIPFVVVPMIVFGRQVRRKSRFAQDTLADASAYASEAIGAVRTLQAFTNEEFASNRFSAAVERAFQAARASTKARAVLTAIAIFIVFASIVCVLWIGATDVLAGRLTGGSLSQFVLYSVIAAASLGELSQVWGEIALASGAAERLSELLNTRSAIRTPDDPKPLPEPVRGEVSFEAVSFAYPGVPQAGVLSGITTTIQPGETVALVGPSGAGKSTLFHLILRFYDPTAGTLRLDGVDLRHVDLDALRKRMALVPQDTVVFGASIAENIRYGRPEASLDEIKAAARAAHAEEFVLSLENGYDTLVGERGVTLSGGQRQRIAIARAVLNDAPVLLLDEATSALDAESEVQVQEALETLMQDRTTLVIAHRLATVLKADRILVLDKGVIVEEGDHQSLVEKGGLYARLAKLQFETGAAALNGNGDVKAAE